MADKIVSLQNIAVGSSPNDNTGDVLRLGGQRVNANNAEIKDEVEFAHSRIDDVELDLLSVSGEIVAGRGGQASLDARFDLLDAFNATHNGGAFNTKLASDLPSTYSDGFSFGIVSTGGWPGTGVGIWKAYKRQGTNLVAQEFLSSSGTKYTRYGTSGWPATWGASNGQIPSLAFATPITSYPPGDSNMPVLVANGWPENGQLETIYNGASSGHQELTGQSGTKYVRVYVSGAWSAFTALGGGGGGGGGNAGQLAAQLLAIRQLGALAQVTETLSGAVETLVGPNIYFTTQLFRGYLCRVLGLSGTFQEVVAAVRPKEVGNVTRIKVFAYDINAAGDTIGSLIASKEIAYSGRAGRLDFVSIRFDAPVTVPSNIALGIHADGPIAFYGHSGASSGGSQSSAFLASSTSDIDSPVWNGFGPGSLPAAIWFRVGNPTDVYTITPTAELVAALGGGSGDVLTNGHQVRDFVDAIATREHTTGLIKGFVIGDSLEARPESSGGPFQSLVKQLYDDLGFGGAGWICFTTDATKGGQPTDLHSTVMSSAGNLTFVDEQEGGAKGLHAGHTLLNDNTAVVQVGSLFEGAKIHYLNQPSGGSFRYRVEDGIKTIGDAVWATGSWTTVNTAGAESLQVINLPTLSRKTHTLRIEGVSGVSLICGAYLTMSSGICMSNIANGSSDTADYASISGLTPWRDSLADLAPNLVLIAHGTNDKRNSISLASYTANIGSIINSVRTARSLCDVIVISPNDHDPTTPGTFTMGDYAAAAKAYCKDNNHCHFSLYDMFGPFSQAAAHGWMDTPASPSFHLSAEGGRVKARFYYTKLFKGILNSRRLFTNIPIHSNASAALSINNLPAAITRLSGTTRGRTQADLSGCVELRVVISRGADSVSANARLYARWSVAAGGTYVGFGDVSAGSPEVISLAAGGSDATSWIAIPDEARTAVYIELVTEEGGGTSDNITMAAVHIQVR